MKLFADVDSGFYAEAKRELAAIRSERRKRFRILVCLDGTEEAYQGVKIAKKIGHSDECDIILLYVRTIDQGLRSGGLQMRVARQNMLEWELDLPGIQYLKLGRNMLIDAEEQRDKWQTISSHKAIRGDPLGDNKIEYRHKSGKSIVLKLKTAPDIASGILDQYELGPYNLMIIGKPSRWRGQIKSLFRMSVVQRVSMLSPCSVMVARETPGRDGYLICHDGSEHSMDAVQRTAVLAQHCGKTITLMGVARVEEDRDLVNAQLATARANLDRIGIPTAAPICEIGDPVQRIIEVGKHFELTTVSEYGASRLRRLFGGSVAFEVLGAATSSVLDVK